MATMATGRTGGRDTTTRCSPTTSNIVRKGDESMSLSVAEPTMTAGDGIKVAADDATTRLDRNEQNAVVAVYDTHQEAEAAIRELQHAGVDMTKLSVVGKGYHTEEDVVGYYT